MARSIVLNNGYTPNTWRMLDHDLPTGKMESIIIKSGIAESDLHIVARSYFNHEGFDGYFYVSIHVNGQRIADSYVAKNYPNWGGDWKSFIPRGSCSAICPKGQEYKISIEYCSTFPESNPNNESPWVEYNMMGLGYRGILQRWFRVFRRSP